MQIGVPKEIKKQEHRVGMVPASVREMVAHGHKVLVETGAGAGIGFDDAAYQASGAEIAGTPAEIFAKADMIVKVKEPQASECAMLRPDQILFTYLHLAADRAQAEGLIKSGAVAIAYETVTGPDGRGLPLLAPMSEIAGRLSVQVGAHFLQKHLGGLGRLIGGVPGASAPKLVRKEMLKTMKAGSVMVDIAIDQGGCFETSHATTHADPVFVVDGVIHYCVANMPGAVPLTSAMALNQSVLPYALKLADKGWEKALASDKGFQAGLNICKGLVTHEGVAESLGLPYQAG